MRSTEALMAEGIAVDQYVRAPRSALAAPDPAADATDGPISIRVALADRIRALASAPSPEVKP